jgi:SAM-dependent methyltransferase
MARKLAQTKPARHVDFGGLTYFVSIASAICPIDFYDIRRIQISLPGVTTGTADFTKLPMPDNSIKSLSSGHCLEHVGLGRYSDELDVQGDLKAARELKRVLAPGGQALIVLPVGMPKIVFNAHRIYSYEMVLEMFSGLQLKEFTLFDPPQYIENANPERVKGIAEGAGCFLFVK